MDESKRIFVGIDLGKIFFAILILFLHIPFHTDEGWIYILRQYLARLGVPFFFAISGMMLSSSLNKRGVKALNRYFKRIGLMLLFWTVIYFPLFLSSTSNVYILMKEILFKTPGFLWYLTASLVACIPFCLVHNRKLLYIGGIILYLLGTLFGGSYTWLSGGCSIYETIFITTRNGIFYGLPMFCVGELILKYPINRKNSFWGFVISEAILAIEITFVQKNILPGTDCSMYFMIPVVVFFLIQWLKDIKVSFNNTNSSVFLRQLSSAIYVVQFGVITVMGKVLKFFDISSIFNGWIIFITIIITGIFLLIFSEKIKFLKLLF